MLISNRDYDWWLYSIVWYSSLSYAITLQHTIKLIYISTVSLATTRRLAQLIIAKSPNAVHYEFVVPWQEIILQPQTTSVGKPKKTCYHSCTNIKQRLWLVVVHNYWLVLSLTHNKTSLATTWGGWTSLVPRPHPREAWQAGHETKVGHGWPLLIETTEVITKLILQGR